MTKDISLNKKEMITEGGLERSQRKFKKYVKLNENENAMTEKINEKLVL